MAKQGRRKQRDEELVNALSLGFSWQQAAAHAGVSLSTVRRRLAEPGFQAQVDQARAERREQIAAELTGHVTTAIRTLAGIVRDDQQRAADRIRAASVLLSEQYKRTDVLEALERLDQVQAPAPEHPWDL